MELHNPPKITTEDCTVYFLTSPKGQDSPPKGQGMTPDKEGEEWGQLQALASPATLQLRRKPEVTKQTILLLCQGRFLSLNQLAKLLGRKPTTLQNKVLSHMLKDGLLKLRFPNSKNRPDQAYTSASEGATP